MTAQSDAVLLAFNGPALSFGLQKVVDIVALSLVYGRFYVRYAGDWFLSLSEDRRGGEQIVTGMQ